MGRVQGKVALVTGAATGIGREIACMLSAEGAKLVLADIDREQSLNTLKLIAEAGGEAISVAHDVSSEDSWQQLMERTEKAFGALNVVVNNAGIGVGNGDVEKLTLKDWHRIMNVNLDGTFLGTQHAIRTMRQTGQKGSIVNIASVLGIVASAPTAAYTASKGGVRAFTKSAALHCARAGYAIRVNSIHPGFIATPFLEAAFDRDGRGDSNRRHVIDMTPMGRLGTPRDVGYGVLYLASDESSYVTGSELVIDGGYIAR